MDKKDQPKFDMSSTNLIVFLYTWRKLLIGVSLLAAVVSIVVSLLIEEKYKSSVIMFPTTTNSISKALIAENSGTADLLRLGEEEQAEQMLQVLNSDEIRNRIIEKYNLMDHYNIDPEGKYKYTNLFKEYESNISFHRTEYMSVEIEVLDRNPDTAAMIANDIAALLDTVRNRMEKEMAREALKIVEAEYFGMQKYMSRMEDSLNKIRALGIHDPESQAEVLTQELAIAQRENEDRAAEKIQEKLDLLAKYGGTFVSIRDNFEWDRKQLSYLRTKYNEAKIDAEKSLEHKFVVNSAEPAEKKSYPIRWLIVVGSTVGAFLFTLLAIMTYLSLKSLHLRDKASDIVESGKS